MADNYCLHSMQQTWANLCRCGWRSDCWKLGSNCIVLFFSVLHSHPLRLPPLLNWKMQIAVTFKKDCSEGCNNKIAYSQSLAFLLPSLAVPHPSPLRRFLPHFIFTSLLLVQTMAPLAAVVRRPDALLGYFARGRTKNLAPLPGFLKSLMTMWCP